ncbi:hypothetical protein BS47DRAFT_1366718 [Hydnum rufescens UP504]|uniref:Uncharacterized protein n=1 Tax=Hydnum rufescens UP504 TaxID=1448309 RepID=A0A9P6AK18_9AGAM|nr:hypothetical protein BS47DRAFT_1366718 [Hydnum rufescens UP504]
MLNPPVFLVLNPPIFLMLNLAIALMVILAVGLLLGPRSGRHLVSPAPSHTSSHTFGNSPFFGILIVRPSFLVWIISDENLVILDPPNPNDGNPDVEDDDSVAEEGDTAQIKSQGGPFTDEQVAEIRGIVESMNRELKRKAKENLAISTREWQSAGNLWNAYQASYEKDPSQTVPITNSNAWKKKLKELVDQHNASKAAQAFDIVLSLAAMGKAIKQTTKRWKDDLKWMATMNIHGFCGIISSIPDEVASKQNALFTGSPAMKDWLNLSFPKDRATSLTPKSEAKDSKSGTAYTLGKSPQFLANNKLKIENWVAESEFPSLLSLDVSVVRTESWKKLWHTFFQPSDDSTKVRVTQLKHITQENNGKLPSDTVIVSDQFNNPLLTVAQVDGPGEPNESNANSANGTSIAGGASGPRKRASQGDGPSRKKKKMGPKHPMSAEFIDEPSDDDGPVTDTFENPGGASSVGGQSSGTTWGGAGSSVDGVVNGQFSGNAPSGAINGPMDWAGGYGQNQQEYNPHDNPLMASLFARYPDLNLGLNQGFDDGFPL